MAKPRIKTPSTAKAGEVFQVKTILKHKMEMGNRKDKKTGKTIPRNIVNKFECLYNGKTVFAAHQEPGISANPYIAFYVKATESGTLEFKWTEDNGKVTAETRKLTVN